MPVNRIIDENRVGVCSWSFGQPLDQVAAAMEELGVNLINLALQPFLGGDRHGARETSVACDMVRQRIKSGEWKVSSTMISFTHEDYTSPQSIRRTGGVMPDVHWPDVLETTRCASELTAELGVPFMLMHAGHLDWDDAIGAEKFVDRVTRLAEVCVSSGVTLLLETGQETADDLVRLMPLVPSVGINFDPGNMIDGNRGDPCVAVQKLMPWIRHVHIKDSLRPISSDVWGTEVPWGEGDVDTERFLRTLDGLGYAGDFAVERESGDDRVGDIGRAVKSLRAFLRGAVK